MFSYILVFFRGRSPQSNTKTPRTASLEVALILTADRKRQGRVLAFLKNMDTKAFTSPTSQKSIAKRLQPRAHIPTAQNQVEWQLPISATSIPEGDQWLHELNLEGYRTRVTIKNKNIAFHNRAGQDWTDKYPRLSVEFFKLGLTDAVFDGQVVALDNKGRSSLKLLQQNVKSGITQNLIFFAFDLLFLDGRDLRSLPLEERKLRLKQVLKKSTSNFIYFSDHTRWSGKDFFTIAVDQGFNGIVSKRRHESYRSGRNSHWQISTQQNHQDFIFIGYTPGVGKNKIKEILLGAYQNKKLIYVGKIKANLDKNSLAVFIDYINSNSQEQSPFKKPPVTGLGKAIWVKPNCVIEVFFKRWSPNNRLIEPSFFSFRDDKLPETVDVEW